MLVEVVLLTIVCAVSISALKSASTEDLHREAKITSNLLISATMNSLLATDLASLEVLTDEFSANPDVIYVRVFDRQRLMAESGVLTNLRKALYTDTESQNVATDIYEFSSPISLDGYEYGRLEIGLDAARIYSRIDDAKNNLITISIIGIIASALFSFFLGDRLTRQFEVITRASSELTKENFGHKIEVIGKDELATAARSFNIMAEKIQQLLSVSKDQQREITDREVILRTLLESIPAGILLGDENRVAIFSNQNLVEIFDWNSIEDFDVDGKDCSNLLPLILQKTKNPDGFLQFVNDSISKSCTVKNHQVDLINDKTIEVDYVPIYVAEGNTKKHLWYFRDITQIISTEKSSKKTAQELASIFKLSPDGIAYFDINGVILRANSTFCNLTGIDEQKVAGLSLRALDHVLIHLMVDSSCFKFTDYRSEITKSITYGTRRELTDTFEIKQNSIIHLERSIIFDSDNNLTGGFIYLKDITEIKKIEIMKSEFLSTTAHELRSPMANIFGYSELLLEKDFKKSQQLEFISIIHDQTQRLVYIIDDLLDLARIESQAAGDLNIETSDLKEILIKSADTHRSKSEKHTIQTIIDPTLPHLRFDKNKVHQVLNNIIDNAIKYSPRGGDIHISAYMEYMEGISGAQIKIKDGGIGMSSTQLDRVFERFYRADTSGKIPGTGLGMSIVKEIMDLHGGNISISSKEQSGTTVKLWFPIL